MANRELCSMLRSTTDSLQHERRQNVKLYDQFLRSMDRIIEKQDVLVQVLVDRALLDLHHPVRPNPYRLLGLLRNETNSEDVSIWLDRFFQPHSYSDAESVVKGIARTAKVCVAYGRRTDAIWVMDLAYERNPELFTSKSSSFQYMKTLDMLSRNSSKRKPKPWEVENGIVVDQDGFVTTPWPNVLARKGRNGRSEDKCKGSDVA